ncbi:MAG: exosortase C-terminal domain/associated protein EpsI [Candidatus Omnitrophota bacterium]
MNNRNFIIAVVIIVFAAIIANAPLKFDPAKETRVENFPKTIGGWQGTDIPLEKRDYEILETTNLIMREYKNEKGNIVYLYIIYSGDNRRALHPPEVCYSGSGATMLNKSVIPITNSLKANKFTVENKDSRQLVVYWFKSNELNTYNYLKQQIKSVVGRMLGKQASGAMIRVSTEIKNGDQDEALKLIKAFCKQIEPLLKKYVP